MSLIQLSASTPAVLRRGHAAAVAALLAGAAGIHLAAAAEHTSEYLLFGLAFYAMAAVQLLAACAFLAGQGSGRLRTATIVMNVSIALLWATTRLVGLPVGPEHWQPEDVGVLDAGCTLLELLAVGVLLRGTVSGGRSG
jgi:hypothetical protein